MGQIKRFDEQARISDLPAAAAAHEAPKLLLLRPSLPSRLLLEGAERSKVSLSIDDLFHGGGPEGADQLVLQVYDAHVETKSFHVGASEPGADARSLETAPEVLLFGGVAKAREPDVQPPRTEPLEEAADRLRSADRHDGDALSAEIPTTALSQRFECALVADPFNENDATFDEGLGHRQQGIAVRWPIIAA
jgi:hypothetical protein